MLIPLQNFRQSNTSPEAGLELDTIQACIRKQSTYAQVTTLQQSKQKLAQAETTESTLTTSAPSTSGQTILTNRQAMLKSKLKLGQQVLDLKPNELS